MKYYVKWALCLLLALPCIAQAQRFTLSGFITDKASGERLKGVSVMVPGKNVGTTSNNYGFFSITLPADSIDLVVSFSGYQPYEQKLYLSQNLELAVGLEPVAKQQQEVTVKAVRRTAIQNRTQMSSIDLPIETIKSLPRFLGEADVMKAIQLLPGVQSGNEGQSGIYVRGGGPDQNLILLDGVPVYNVSHLFGFFSVFNTDAVKSVELIKGGFPARYGGRLSSVLDIQMKEGNKKQLRGEGGIGFVASRLTLEGPFKKGKESSFMVSGRRTYLDLITRPIIKAEEGIDLGYFFYDLNAKVNLKLSEKDHLYISGYFGKDKFYSREKDADYSFNTGLFWGNATAVARWNHLFSNKVFGNLTAHLSKYDFEVKSEEKSTNASSNDYFRLRYFSGIQDVSFKYDLDILPNPNHFIKMGTGVVFHYYKPGAIQLKETGSITTGTDTLLKDRFVRSVETDTYIEDDIRITPKLKTNIGLHFATFTVDGKTFTSLQPRLSARYLLNNDLSAKVSYAQMNQYIHLLSNSGIGLPTDLWVPVTQRVPPQVAHQVAAGLAYNLNDRYEFSVEGYYKTMRNVIEYAEGATYLDPASNWENKVEVGNAKSYGAEFFIQRKKGRLTGLLGYTLSQTNRQFDNINFGKTFPYRYDRRHDFKVAVVYQLTKKIEVSADWVYGTGQAISLPAEKYIDAQGNEVLVYKERNGYRMPAMHRMDLSISFFKQKKKWSRSWVVSVYNVYNRMNPFYIYLGTRDNPPYDPVFKRAALFPIIPSISYQFKF
jgi:TonB-dependent Receptor Plug Domain/CarboxypepD_reg-like domain